MLGLHGLFLVGGGRPAAVGEDLRELLDEGLGGLGLHVFVDAERQCALQRLERRLTRAALELGIRLRVIDQQPTQQRLVCNIQLPQQEPS